MKNKIILNIIVVCFFIIGVVLLFQISIKETKAIEPLPSEITAQDKLKNSVVLAINSPVAIINEKQFLIDEKNSTLTPVIEQGKVYIPANLLKTAFNADISFSKDTKETIIRLENKAMIFSNSKNTIKILNNTSEEILDIEAESKIINDRFYIPLRSFADIFNKEIFFNDELIIISNMENIFDPIEEMSIIKELLTKVKHLPILGNYENLKGLVAKANIEKTEKSLEQNSSILKDIDIEEALKTNERVIIYKTDNFNFYATKGFIEIYFVTKGNEEIFSFKIEKFNNSIEDIKITDNNFFISYKDNGTKTYIYDISNKESVLELNIIKNNGEFYKNIVEENNFYTISRINTLEEKDKLPEFAINLYKDGVNKEIKEEKFDYSNILYFPDMNDTSYTLMTYVNLYETDNSYNNVYLGMGEKISINEDNIMVATSNKQNNNLYLFEATLDGIKYINRVFIKGDLANINFNEEKNFLEVILNGKTEYFDKNLIKR